VIVLSTDLLKNKLKQQNCDGGSLEIADTIANCATEISRAVRSYAAQNLSKEEWSATSFESSR
jgi:hypothetical protein